MEKKQLLRLFPVFLVIGIGILSRLVAQKIVCDAQLIQIILIVFFLIGFLTYWIIAKLES
ncbi:hypothetical protein J2755_000533 [Methanohalophilus levihalophilus]|nr:hypothetical protein [Methanohalophilus levihalophilus]